MAKKNFLEKIGIIERRVPDEPDTDTPYDFNQDSYALPMGENNYDTNPIPEFQPMDVEYTNVIGSIYENEHIGDGNSILQIEQYINVLPEELPTAAKQNTVKGILDVQKINLGDLIANAGDRLDALQKGKSSIIVSSEETIHEAELKIESLKEQISAENALIAQTKDKMANSISAIEREVERINKLVTFAQGMVPQTDDSVVPGSSEFNA